MEIEKICADVLEYGFAAACVPPPWVSLSHRLGVRTATVIGFPFGYATAAAKLAEAEKAVADGADELDVMINLILLKDRNYEGLVTEMDELVDRAHATGKIVKVIIESGILTNEEIITCCELYAPLGVDFLKTSTGYAERGATVEAVRLMRASLPAAVGIKAAGGIREAAFARELIAAGAGRLGCSASVAIIRQDSSAPEPQRPGNGRAGAAESHGAANYY